VIYLIRGRFVGVLSGWLRAIADKSRVSKLRYRTNAG